MPIDVQIITRGIKEYVFQLQCGIQNIFITITIIANKSVVAIQVQQKDLNLLPALLLDNKIASDYLLAAQCGTCLVAKTFNCIGINVS